MSGRDFGTTSCSAIINPAQLQETLSYVSEIKQSCSWVFSFPSSRIGQIDMPAEKWFLKLSFVITINHQQNRLCTKIHDFPVLLVTSLTSTCKCALCRNQNQQNNKFHTLCKHKEPSYSQFYLLFILRTLQDFWERTLETVVHPEDDSLCLTCSTEEVAKAQPVRCYVEPPEVSTK